MGSISARFLAGMGARIVAISDVTGGVYAPEGLNLEELTRFAKTNGGVKGFTHGKYVTNEELLTLPVDILIPAALGDVITTEIAHNMKARLIVEGANNPTFPEADEILNKNGVVVVPDILANAGGVIVSYFEWVQNLQNFRWTYEQVVREQDSKMSQAFDKVYEVAKSRNLSLRLAAFYVAIERVAKATELGGF